MTLIPKKDLVAVGEECFDANSKTGVDPQTHELVKKTPMLWNIEGKRQLILGGYVVGECY